MTTSTQQSRRTQRTGTIAAGAAVAAMLAVAVAVSIPGLSGAAATGYDAMYGAMVYMAELCRF